MVNRQKKMLGWTNTIKTGARSLLGKELSNALNKKAVSAVGSIPTFKKGGKVKRTGKIYAHKGEVVLSVAKVRKLKKLIH